MHTIVFEYSSITAGEIKDQDSIYSNVEMDTYLSWVQCTCMHDVQRYVTRLANTKGIQGLGGRYSNIFSLYNCTCTPMHLYIGVVSYIQCIPILVNCEGTCTGICFDIMFDYITSIFQFIIHYLTLNNHNLPPDFDSLNTSRYSVSDERIIEQTKSFQYPTSSTKAR